MGAESFAEFMSRYHKDGFLHESGEMHKQMIYHLANGDKDFFSESNIDFLGFSAGTLSDDPLRQSQNLMISVCSVFEKYRSKMWLIMSATPQAI